MALFSRRASTGTRPPAVSVAPSPRTADPAAASGPGREDRIRQLGAEMLEKARGHRSGLLSAKFWSDKLMDWSMKDQAFKVQLFRFVDAFPMLKTSDAVHEHLVDYLTQPGVTPPPGMAMGLAAGGLAKGLLTSTVSGQIKAMAAKFIAGTDAADALPQLEKLWKDDIAFSVDLLGEACVSEEEADQYAAKYLDLISNLPAKVASWPAKPLLERDHLGAVPRVNVSIKISSLSARMDAIDTEGSIAALTARLGPILEAARSKGVLINFDMEQFALKDLTLELFQRCCEKWDFHAGLAMQAYLKSGDEDARRIAEWSRRTGRVVTVRLVKGAYWDFETIHAEQMGWPSPVWTTKKQTDACFERMVEIFLDSTPRKAGEGGVKLALGSHNVRSIASALDALERRGLARESIELQMLHGMADQLKGAASELGLRVREYVPVGQMIPGMAYLVRRLLENTSNESWLKAGFLDNADPSALLASPHGSPAKPDLYLSAPERHALSAAAQGVGDGKPFVNEPFRNFALSAARQRYSSALASARVPAVANDRTPKDGEAAVTSALAAFPAWRDTPIRERAAVLVKAAAIMRERRDELSAVMIKEAGKTWREADADTCEAIDFCEYYAREAVPMFEPRRLGRFIGELDQQFHQARGVALVIAPWNFPLAICCGMTAAALVTGNTAIVKPAEQTPGIAKLMVDILHQAGCPKNVLHFVPAPGETTGAALVRDPRISVIAFTGSMAVGLDILHAAAPASPFSGAATAKLSHVKKVVCEMGGKNAVIIDESADLDEAVLGVRHSAFGFQGQKCSACSRCIVLESCHDQFLHRLVEATRALVIGDPSLPGTDVGPVIDDEARAKIMRFVAHGKAQSKLALAMEVPAGLEAKTGRAYVAPHIFSEVLPDHDIAREEIFGPVLAVMRARDFSHALELANASPYKLTGGVFSRKPSHLERARREFRVGNLYLNRGITGALVARQPFGGFGLSGTGSKAGGDEYLLHYTEPRAVCENTMRRGFAPEL